MRRRALGLLAAAALAGGLVACTVDGTFPATSACPSEPRAPGTVPDLEAVLPTTLITLGSNEPARSPTAVDSGWTCLPANLRTLASRGVTRLEFAGVTWDEGNGEGTASAVFRAAPSDPALQAAWIEEFYEATARADRRVSNIETTRESMAGAGAVWRLDALNDLSLQTIVVWPAPPNVRVVIVATTVEPGASRDEHELRVDAAVDSVIDASLGGVPRRSGAG